MTKVPKPVDKKKNLQKKNGRNLFLWLIIVLVTIYIIRLGSLSLEGPINEISYGTFYNMLIGADASQQVVSAVQKDNIIEAVQAGVSGYVIKPFTPETLKKRIEQTLSNKG